MQAYGPGFARVYNARWAGFAKQVAPLIREFYESTPGQNKHKTLLDLCCGAGHLAVHFLEHSYRVVGIDLSVSMLDYARENAAACPGSGIAEFIQADVCDFRLDQSFGLVVSTYDSLNHLDSEDALRACFQCVSRICESHFIFDLNTRRGLKRWSGVQVDDDDEIALIRRGVFDEQNDRALIKITGFVSLTDGNYERFEETVYNTAFDLQRVKQVLESTGWSDAYFARIQQLSDPLESPEEEGRVFVVARK